MTGVAYMARLERLPAAQVEHQGALIHQSDRLHGRQGGEGLQSGADFVKSNRDGKRQSAPREVRMMADELE